MQKKVREIDLKIVKLLNFTKIGLLSNFDLHTLSPMYSKLQRLEIHEFKPLLEVILKIVNLQPL